MRVGGDYGSFKPHELLPVDQQEAWFVEHRNGGRKVCAVGVAILASIIVVGYLALFVLPPSRLIVAVAGLYATVAGFSGLIATVLGSKMWLYGRAGLGAYQLPAARIIKPSR